jgi:hypothetical protein
MRTVKNILLVCIMVLFITPATSYATVIINGTIESKKVTEKYSLRNLSALTHKTATFYTLKSSLVFKGITNSSTNGNFIKYNKGNISYVIPYRYKVVLSKFKTPSPVQY